ncbi:MAG: hypothetical protein QOF77_242 [Solirubrobacteraceae bacterium]|nr:hypothetical protein [Solirubrobacteraceae bacterium]
MKSPGPLPLPDLCRAADARAAALARRFGDALRAGDGAAGERIVNDALGTGMTPEAVQSVVIETSAAPQQTMPNPNAAQAARSWRTRTARRMHRAPATR